MTETDWEAMVGSLFSPSSSSSSLFWGLEVPMIKNPQVAYN